MPKEPAITLHVFRHAEKEKTGDALTPKGELDSFNAGAELGPRIPKDAIVFGRYSKKYLRVQQTLLQILKGARFSPGVVQSVRGRRRLEVPESDNPARRDAEVKGLGQDEYVRRYLVDDPRLRGIAESSTLFANRVKRQTVDVAQRLAKNRAAQGKTGPVHVVVATHQGGLDKLIMNLTGRHFNEIGGLSNPLEYARIRIPSAQSQTIELTYKGRTYIIPRPKRVKGKNAKLPPLPNASKNQA